MNIDKMIEIIKEYKERNDKLSELKVINFKYYTDKNSYVESYEKVWDYLRWARIEDKIKLLLVDKQKIDDLLSDLTLLKKREENLVNMMMIGIVGNTILLY